MRDLPPSKKAAGVAPGFLKEAPGRKVEPSGGPRPQLFLLCGEMVVVSRVGWEGERARKTCEGRGDLLVVW